MKITKRKLRQLVKEYKAHARRGLGSADRWSDFPVLVRYSGRSEIAYDEDDLDSILDGGSPSIIDRGIPYSIDSLSDIELEDVPVGAEIETFAEGSMKITKRQLQGVIREAMGAPPGHTTDYFQEGYADATRYNRPERRYQPEDLDEDNYNDYTDGFEEGLSDREFFGGMISTVTGG